jgi:ABC-type phosphate transport system substrate-binding protein
MKRAILLLTLLALVPAHSLIAAPGFKVIANASVVGDQLSRQVLAGIFLKKNSRWGDGHEIVVVDQSTQSAVRAEFTRDVLEQPLAAVQAYWLRAISSGATPPVVKGSDADVAEFVRTHKGAIGYVSADFAAEGVKLVQITE